MDDVRWMHSALALAARGKGNTSPNPMVGAVIVSRDGSVVGSGFHRRAGDPHAEIEALAEAGDRARGATMYVNLEPCAHHGRTPPCVDAIVAAGVARVVAPIADPDVRAHGRGFDQLRSAGIEVTIGVLADEARALNAAYLHHRSTGRPLLALKMAQTVDGAIGASRTERRRLTGAQAADFVRSLRIEYDAIMVGVATVVVDDPQLTVRPLKPRAVEYTRIVVDSRGSTPLDARVVTDTTIARTIVATTERMPSDVCAALEAAGVEVMRCAADGLGRVDLRDLLNKLGQRGITSVLCEGGPALAGSLVSEGLVDRYYWLVAPQTIGDGEKVPAIDASAPLHIALDIDVVEALGDDMLISGTPRRADVSSPG